jgi:hypothetical protein
MKILDLVAANSPEELKKVFPLIISISLEGQNRYFGFDNDSQMSRFIEEARKQPGFDEKENKIEVLQ